MIGLLRAIKTSIQDTPVHTALKKLGVLQMGQSVYNRKILQRGYHDANVLGRKLKFVVTSRDEIIQIDGLFHEHEFMQRIMDHTRPGDVFYDIGANVGLVSLLVCDVGRGKSVRAVAFEPEPKNAQRVRDNAGINNLQGEIAVEQAGMGSSPGTLKLFLAGYIGDHSMLNQNAEGEHISVPVVTIDDYAKSHAPPTSMKIDVEGFELEVLKGGDRTLASGAVREVFLEVHVDYLKTVGLGPEDIKKFLVDRGFELAWSLPRGGELHQHYRRDR